MAERWSFGAGGSVFDGGEGSVGRIDSGWTSAAVSRRSPRSSNYGLELVGTFPHFRSPDGQHEASPVDVLPLLHDWGEYVSADLDRGLGLLVEVVGMWKHKGPARLVWVDKGPTLSRLASVMLSWGVVRGC